MFEKQAPAVEITEGPMAGERYTHPAYGQISLAKVGAGQGGAELFGSDLNHRSVITITLSTAHLDRHLNRDWIHADRQLMSFKMSESQWASFISSQGGEGVPVTFEYRAPDDSTLQRMPGIESPETMTEQFDREIRERCEDYIGTATELMDGIQKAMDSGKASKATLKDLLDLARNLSVGMPNTMAFVQKQMAGSMEKMVSSGKLELEAYVNDMAKRTGIEALRENAPARLIDQEKNGADIIEQREAHIDWQSLRLADAFALRIAQKQIHTDTHLHKEEIEEWQEPLERSGASVEQIIAVADWWARDYYNKPCMRRVLAAVAALINDGKIPARRTPR